MQQRCVEGSHQFADFIAKECGIYELGGLLMGEQNKFTAGVEAFELEPNELDKTNIRDLLKKEKYFSAVAAGCSLCNQLDVPYYILMREKPTNKIHCIEIIAEFGESEPRLIQRSQQTMNTEEFLSWWLEHKTTTQTKQYRKDFLNRVQHSFFDSILESNQQKWGGNIDGMVIQDFKTGKLLAIVENRFTNKTPLSQYNPADYYRDDVNTWSPLICLKELLKVPLFLFTYSNRRGEEHCVGLSTVINSLDDKRTLKFMTDEHGHELPPCENIVSSPESVRMYIDNVLRG